MATKAEVVSWLRQSEPAFINKLTEIGVKRGLGFHKKVDGICERDVEDGGEFTGDGLCYVAAGAIEAGARKKFGHTVETRGAILSAVRKDTGKPAPFLHHVMRIEAEDGQVTADATFRQLHFEAKNRVYVFPSEREKRVYGGREVEKLYPGECVVDASLSIGRGMVRNVTSKDFDELVDTLK